MICKLLLAGASLCALSVAVPALAQTAPPNYPAATNPQATDDIPVWPAGGGAGSGRKESPSQLVQSGGGLTAVPAPQISSLGGLYALGVTAHQFVTGLSTAGQLIAAQPAFSDLSGSIGVSQASALTPVRTLVSNRAHVPDQAVNNTSNFQTMNRLVYTSPTGASDLVLCFAGWHLGPAEFALPTANFSMATVTVTAGGSGHALNDIITLPSAAIASGPTGTPRVGRVRVVAVSSGVVTAVAIEDPGIWSAPVTGAQTQAATTGSGTGATFTVTGWNAFATHVRVAVEPSASATQTTTGPNAIRPVKFGGQQSAGTSSVLSNTTMTPSLDGEVPSGKMLCSDPVNVNIAAGGKFAVRVWTDGVSTGFGNIMSNAGDISGFGTPGTTDYSQSGVLSPQSGSGAPAYGPALIMGTPATVKTTFAIMGTSIDWGTTGGTPSVDYGDSYGDQGWFQRAMGPTNPLVSFASAGNQINYLFNPNYGRQAELDAITRAGAQDIGSFYGVNDMNAALGNLDEAVVLADEVQLSSELRGIRTVKKVFTYTSPPYAASSANTAPNATCARSSGTTWLGTNGIEIRNFLLRQGLIPWNGSSGDTYAQPMTGLTLGAAAVSTGAQTITPSAMTITGNGASWSIAPGMTILVNPGGADQEAVTVTATNDTYTNGYPTAIGTTFTATFVNAHAAGESITIYSPYAHYAQYGQGGYDFVIDWSTQLESSLGSCLWVVTSDTGDGLHPSYLTQMTGGHVHMAAIAQPIIAANQ
jgi:hypothetical protein